MSIIVTGLLVTATLVYGLYTLYISRGLLLAIPTHDRPDLPSVAVVIAARNESENLPQLLADLAAQDYSGQLDCYIADDRSTDATWSILDQFSKQHKHFHPVRITIKSELMTPKKNALTECLKRTTAEIIMTTDADCQVGPGWVTSAVSQMDDEVGILVGYSQVESPRIFDKYQALDFIGIMVSNAGMMANGYAWSGSGQNLAYRRSAFTAINGFNPVSDRVSGDDVYLVQSISARPGLTAKFNFDHNNFVRTQPMESIQAFINQRIRWSSNSRGMEKTDPLFFGFLLSAFISNALLLVSILFGLTGIAFWLSAALKFLGEGAVMILGARRFNYWALLPVYPIWFIIQPIYITFVGLMGLRGKYSWKP